MLTMIAAAAVAAQAPVERCEAELLDYGAWREAPDQRWDYHWSAGPDGGELTVVGVEHQRDPAHPQFARIAAAYARAAPGLIFFEGPDRGIADSA
ncbi:MAG TPA: hypothetical protein VEA60_08610, partial [Allosphingosinicella sp.]|nr:hypothetical protein [Allosphingosinicella sp.]